MTFVVAVYETNRAYGGPEEGGWWYDTGELIEKDRARRFATREEAEAYHATLAPFVTEANEGRREPGSVLCDGWIEAQIWHVEDHEGIPDFYPEVRPHYE